MSFSIKLFVDKLSFVLRICVLFFWGPLCFRCFMFLEELKFIFFIDSLLGQYGCSVGSIGSAVQIVIRNRPYAILVLSTFCFTLLIKLLCMILIWNFPII